MCEFGTLPNFSHYGFLFVVPLFRLATLAYFLFNNFYQIMTEGLNDTIYVLVLDNCIRGYDLDSDFARVWIYQAVKRIELHPN